MLQQDKLDFSTRRAHLSTSKRMLLEKRLRGDSARVWEYSLLPDCHSKDLYPSL